MKTSVLIILTVTVLSRRRFGGHEQRLQERATRLVRSDVHRTAPHKASASCPDLQPCVDKFRIRLCIDVSRCGLYQWISSADLSSVATAEGAGLQNGGRKRRWIAHNNAPFTWRIAIHER